MPARRRIFHVASTIDPYGASRQLQLLVRGLRDEGWESTVVALRTLGDSHHAIESAGAQVIRLQQRWTVDPIAAGRLAGLLRADRSDLVHCWDLPALVYSHAVRWRRAEAPMLASMTSLRIDLRLHRRRLRQSLGRTCRLVVGHAAMRQQCAEAGVDSAKLQVIPSGVALPGEPACPRDRLLTELDLPSDARLIAVVGPLMPHKRVDDAIWSFELVRVLYENARLLVIGDGPERRRLERFARLVCEPDTVRFLGLRSDVADILPHADVLWQQSEWEASPNAVLEAMAAGVPVVVTDIGPHRQFVDHERTGFLVPVGSRADNTRMTDRLLADAALARRLGDSGRQFVASRFSVERMVRAYVQLYEQLLAGEQGSDSC